MKILNVNHTIDPVSGGGTAERTFQMSRHLIEDGIRCAILAMDQHPDRRRQLAGGEIILLPMASRRFNVPKASLSRIDALVRASDVVHLMGHWTPLNALVYRAASRHGVPFVFCPAGALPIFGRSKLLKQAYNFVIGRKIARDASKCIAITEAERAHFADYGVDAGKVLVIPNGVDEFDFQANDERGFRSKFGLPDRPFLLFFGRLNPIKGPDLLLRAFARISAEFPGFDLVVAGPDDGMLGELRRFAKESGIDGRVHFVGYLGGADKSSAFHAASLLVIPSRQEAMSIVVLEAGICGTPALFTDRCGLEQVAAADCGRMVHATAEGLEQGLRSLLSAPEQVRAMREKVKPYVSANFAWKSIAARYRTMYRELIGS